MRLKTNNGTIKLWLSSNDTYDWSHKPGAAWPCSKLSNKRLFIEIQNDNLIEILVNNRVPGERVIDDHSELYALVSDKLKEAGLTWPNLSKEERN